jgi:predicted AAA+ superfamily ATPase
VAPGIPASQRGKDRELTDRQRERTLRGYVDTYLREEIQAEALVRDVGGFARLLEVVAAASGRVLNLHALSGDVGVAYETARRYIEVLEDTLVARRVPAWSGSDRASLVAHPKLFLFDIGVRNALLRRELAHPSPDERGLLLEHLVAQEIHARLGETLSAGVLSHFRTKHGVEVDFVLTVGREIWAIEVKSSKKIDAKARLLIVFLGTRRQRIGEVEVLPLGEFLGELDR